MKKLFKSAMVGITILGITAAPVFAAIPDGTVIFGDGNAYALNYANNTANLSSIQKEVVNNNQIWVDTFSGSLVNISTGATLTPTQITTLIPAVTYKDALENVEYFSSGDGAEITNDVITGTLTSASFGSLVRINITNPVIFAGATQFQIYENGTAVSAMAPLNSATTVYPSLDIGNTVQVEFYNATGTQVGTTQNAILNNTFNITVNPDALSLPGGIESNLPDATVGTAYTANIKATGGTPPYRYEASGLPAGLTMGTDGTISGTPIQTTLPTEGGGVTDIFTVSVTDSTTPTAVTVSQDFHIITVNSDALCLPRGIASTLPFGTVGTTYTASVKATGGTPPYRYAASSLPAGLTMGSDGTISGTPIQDWPTSPLWGGVSDIFTVSVTDSATPTAGTVSQNFNITVRSAPSVVPIISLNKLPQPLAVVGTPYKSIYICVTGGTPPYSLVLASGSTLPAGLTLSTDGGMYGMNGIISGTPTESGTTSFTLIATDSAKPTPKTSTATFSFSVLPALSLPSATLPNATVGTPYTASIKATGGIPSYSLTSYSYALASGNQLPAGLTMGTDGTISGTPTVSGTTSFKVNVIDGLTVGESTARTASQIFSITVLSANN